ncbi:unnamed protein product [Blumeria hordei]|uniref:Uncharacterized protein n=1 Tax=Blumeria hordei TaxID=2867405 RepID=A0A383V0K9_BLUHO|nr:unnamed protein product [Blumeria hordei]
MNMEDRRCRERMELLSQVILRATSTEPRWRRLAPASCRQRIINDGLRLNGISRTVTPSSLLKINY